MKTLTSSVTLAVVLFAAAPAFSAPKSLPGDPPPPPTPDESPSQGRRDAASIAGGFDSSAAAGDIFAMMLEYQKLLNKERREDQKLARQDARLQLELAEQKLERDHAALLAHDDSKQRLRTLDDLRSKTLDAAVAAVPKTAPLRDKAMVDVLRAEESSIAKAIAAAEALPADKRRGEYEAARARAEYSRQQTQTMMDAARDSSERSKTFIKEIDDLRKKFGKDGEVAAARLVVP